MNTKRKEFNIGDLVFAKIQGFTTWPAKIIKYENRRFIVYFYGTGQTGKVNYNNLHPYVEFKEIYATKKSLKHVKFRKGIEEIEVVLNSKNSALDKNVENKEFLVDDTVAVKEYTEITTGDGIEKTKTKLTKSNEEKIKQVSRIGKDINTKPTDGQPNKGERKVPFEGSRAKPQRIAVSKKAKRSTNRAEKYNILLTALKNELIGIRLDYNKPKTFIDCIEEKKWDDNALIEAEDLKDQIVLGLVKIQDLKDRIIINPKNSKIQDDAVTRFTKEMVDQEAALFLERDFAQFCMDLKEFIRLDCAYIARSFEILDIITELQLTPIMLKRNFDCVDIIRSVRQYVGNTTFWDLPPEKEASFAVEAELIRSKATFIYTNFKKMFEVPPGEHFWNFFRKEVDAFQEATKHIKRDNRTLITDKMYKNIDKLRKKATPELKSNSNENATSAQSSAEKE